ncbi:MAG: ceramide glucosyltransferase [Chthoniobacter sp.]|jgi:hypothetical protein|nr:ceramide glucosyltransferase [Chthoniobacter sp.]
MSGLPAVAALATVGAAGLFYLVLGWSLVRHWLNEPVVATDQLPAVTLLRPLKAGVPALRPKLEQLALALRPGDQLVIGVDESSEEEAVAESVRTACAGREIVIVRCRPGAALNPKISKLVQMEPQCRHEHWILSDSETIIDTAWLDAFRCEWLGSGADVLSAGYRFVGLDSWPQRLDAAAVLLSLWPGLALMRRFGTVRFTLGACTGLRRSDLLDSGGWAAFGGFLAEDHRLGAALAGRGRRIRLSAQVATIESDPLTWRDYWRHQCRVAVTYRVSNPAGFAGMALTHGVTASLLLIAIAPSRWTGLFFLVHFAARSWAANRLARSLRFPFPRLWMALLPGGLVETFCWARSWIATSVWWAGRRWRVSSGGELSPAAK